MVVVAPRFAQKQEGSTLFILKLVVDPGGRPGPVELETTLSVLQTEQLTVVDDVTVVHNGLAGFVPRTRRLHEEDEVLAEGAVVEVGGDVDCVA